MSKLLILLLLLVAVSAPVLAGCASPGGNTAVATPNPPTPTAAVGFFPGNLAPDFSYTNSKGQTVSLSELRGRPVMLNFWASWCGPCRAEMPLIEQVYRDLRWRGRGLELLAANIGEDSDKVQKFMGDSGYTFPVLLDLQGRIASAYNVRGIPATFFIGKDGIIQTRKDGAFSSKEELERELSKIM